MEIKRYKASQVLLVSNQQKPKTVVYTISGLSNVRTFHMQQTHTPSSVIKKSNRNLLQLFHFLLLLLSSVATVQMKNILSHFFTFFVFIQDI